jgi:hypothetical protein
MVETTEQPPKNWKDPSKYKIVHEIDRPNDVIDHRPNGGPLLSYVWCDTKLQGQDLYLGAEVAASNGKIYCIPGHAPQVMKVDPSTDRATLVGPVIKGKYKWLRGVQVGNVVYGLPCNTGTVLKITIVENEKENPGTEEIVEELSIDYQSTCVNGSSEDTEEPLVVSVEEQQLQKWKYHGGAVSPIDGCIYCIPQSALFVLKIDPKTDQCSMFGPPLPGKYKWYGGVVGKQDGAIYGIPHNSHSVIRIHPIDGVTLHGHYEGLHKWHGASRASNGTIVSVPANADSVLCITPASPAPILQLVGASVLLQGSMGRHRLDRKYKYLGGSPGPDGRVFCFPCAAEHVLAVDTTTMTATEVGPNIYDHDLERICQNKWQNGVVSGNVIWAVPLASESVLKIEFSKDAKEPTITTWPLPGPHRGLHKWEGGVLAPNGVVYTVPNSHKAMLRIEYASSDNQNDDEGISKGRQQHVSENYLVYKSGIPTLRASAHRVKLSLKHRKQNPRPRDSIGNETGTLWLPEPLRKAGVLAYDTDRYDMVGAVVDLLKKCDPNVVGEFRAGSQRLEDFVVPSSSTWRKVNGGTCEDAQRYLSIRVSANEKFMKIFDDLVENAVAPYLHRKLEESGLTQKKTTMYYQRPPTIRIQPGPARAHVKAHNDAEYGHQYGELNFWLPLTDRSQNGVDLHCESSFNANDYSPIPAKVGEIAVFHGSSCRHYVNNNQTPFSRISFDFRIGVQGFFDPSWEMQGTNDDHTRRTIVYQ